jgi:hypothetical protein
MSWILTISISGPMACLAQKARTSLVFCRSETPSLFVVRRHDLLHNAGSCSESEISLGYLADVKIPMVPPDLGNAYPLRT